MAWSILITRYGVLTLEYLLFYVVVSLYNGVATMKAELLSETKCVPGSYQEKKLVLSYVNLYLFGTT